MMGSNLIIFLVPRIKSLVQGNIRKYNFKDVLDNKYKEFRTKDRTKCDAFEKCNYWEDCLGGAYHTWNFEKGIKDRCIYNLIHEKDSIRYL